MEIQEISPDIVGDIMSYQQNYCGKQPLSVDNSVEKWTKRMIFMKIILGFRKLILKRWLEDGLHIKV